MSPDLRVALSPFAPDSSTGWTDLKVVDDAVLIVQATIKWSTCISDRRHGSFDLGHRPCVRPGRRPE